MLGVSFVTPALEAEDTCERTRTSLNESDAS